MSHGATNGFDSTCFRERRALDHGYVRLIEMMGNDERIVQAARVSIEGGSVKSVSDTATLIRYLMRQRHTSPFETVPFTIEMKLPIFGARQFVRHRTQALNEMSARYGVLPAEFYVPAEEHIQLQAEKNKQGRQEATLPSAAAHRVAFHQEAEQAFAQYDARLNDGMARELARINLPLATYTKWWTTISLHNLLHMLSLRLDSHAQFEARAYAEPLAAIVKETCPIAWRAFEDYRLNALSLSALDIEAISRISDVLTDEYPPDTRARMIAMIIEEVFNNKREREEFATKAKRLNLI